MIEILDKCQVACKFTQRYNVTRELVRIYTRLEHHSSTKQEQGKHAQDTCISCKHNVGAIAQTTEPPTIKASERQGSCAPVTSVALKACFCPATHNGLCPWVHNIRTTRNAVPSQQQGTAYRAHAMPWPCMVLPSGKLRQIRATPDTIIYEYRWTLLVEDVHLQSWHTTGLS
jgi:hypothetical protein